MWTNRYNGPASNHDFAFAVAVDRTGNVFVTGTSSVASGKTGYATIAYSGAGVALWTNLYDGNTPTAVAADKSGNVFVTGYAGAPYDYATVAYSGTGVPLWTNRYGGPANHDDYAYAMAVDDGGNVFVTGFAYLSGFDPVYATIKYSSAIPPSLTIAGTTTNTVAISWPSPSTGFTLQQNTNALTTVNWSNVVATPLDDGTTRSVIMDPTTGNRFYRLVHQ